MLYSLQTLLVVSGGTQSLGHNANLLQQDWGKADKPLLGRLTPMLVGCRDLWQCQTFQSGCSSCTAAASRPYYGVQTDPDHSTGSHIRSSHLNSYTVTAFCLQGHLPVSARLLSSCSKTGARQTSLPTLSEGLSCTTMPSTPAALLHAGTSGSLRGFRVSGPVCHTKTGARQTSSFRSSEGLSCKTMAPALAALLHAGTSGSIRRFRVSNSGYLAAAARLGLI